MKTKMKNGHIQTESIGNVHSIFHRLRSVPNITKKLPALIPQDFRMSAPAPFTSPWERLIAVEAERAQVAVFV